MSFQTFLPIGGSTKALILVDEDSWKEFQQLIHRGINLWPDASPELKAFADLITEGKVQQDYSREKKLTDKLGDGVTSYVKCEDKKSYWYNLCNNCGLHLNTHGTGNRCSRWVDFADRNPQYIPEPKLEGF